MFQTLVSHNDDIRRLVERGYAVSFDSNYLIVRDIPYLNQSLALCWGAIVAKLDFVDQDRVKQTDHQVFFAGSVPFGVDGKPIPNLGGGPATLALSEACEDVVVQRSFSNKPVTTGLFEDLYEKVESYVTIISGPAIERHRANPYTFRMVSDDSSDSVFKFRDTLTSRAEITDLSEKLRDDVVALIGLGGTGAYLLDFLVKTPVREIRAFDPDCFFVHNSYRSPGQLSESEFDTGKAEVYQSRYEGFRDGLSCAAKFFDARCSDELDGVTFAFVCVDKGSSRASVFDVLMDKRIPFIDVGMGLNRRRGALAGMVRTTHVSTENAERVRGMGLVPLADEAGEDVYRTNIQIAELNALNASLAILRFKQLRGFYLDDHASDHVIFRVGDLETVGDDEAYEV